jgi:hypothetical protein
MLHTYLGRYLGSESHSGQSIKYMVTRDAGTIYQWHCQVNAQVVGKYQVLVLLRRRDGVIVTMGRLHGVLGIYCQLSSLLMHVDAYAC